MAVLDSSRVVKTRADYLMSAQELIDIAKALASDGGDELRTDIVSSSGTLDVEQQTPVRLEGLDAGDVVQEVMAEQFDTALAATDVGLATWQSRALASIAQDQIRADVIASLPAGGNSIGTVGLDAGSNSIGTVGLDDRTATATTLQDPAGDISGSVSSSLNDNDSFTLYLNAGASVDITVNLSPNGGTDTFEPPESPISFGSSGDDVVRFTYDANHIQLTGSNTTSVQAIIREIV